MALELRVLQMHSWLEPPAGPLNHGFEYRGLNDWDRAWV